MGLAVRSGREEQRRRVRARAERESPEAVDHDRVAGAIAQEVDEAAGGRIIRADSAIPEVAEQQIATEPAEPRGRERPSSPAKMNRALVPPE